MHSTIAISNLHCSSCVRTVQHTLFALQPPPASVDVSIVYRSVSIDHPSDLPLAHIQAALVDAGFDVLDDSPPSAPPRRHSKHVQQCTLCQHATPDTTLHKLTLSIGGMTCSSCVATIKEMVSRLPGVSEVMVNLLSNSATVCVENMSFLSSVTEAIDDCGFQVELVSAEPVLPLSSTRQPPVNLRTVTLRVDGMYCQHCPRKVLDALQDLSPNVSVSKSFIDYNVPLIEISYEPAPPYFTLRNIVSRISSADPAFSVSPYQPPTLEQRSRSMQLREQLALFRRLLVTLIIAIPTFIIGVVYMSLVPQGNASKAYLMEPMWSGNASRIQWSMFFLATPVMFYCAGIFHRRSMREIVATWRRGSSTPIIDRFTRFGSMNLLVSTGVSVAYFASIALLALAASQPRVSDGVGDTTTYFDSVVFLTLFLLCGRYLEAYSKARTADAITALGSLRPAEALLLTPPGFSDVIKYADHDADIEKGGDSELAVIGGPMRAKKVSVQLLEIGDVVRVLNGATPPCDGTIISGSGTSFDESCLTGEARPIRKIVGDKVFLGTINKDRAVDIKVDAVGGVTMLDNIVRTVREGQLRRAPIERIADAVTSVFVPIITLLAINTWIIWLALGLTGSIPSDYLDIQIGGWTVWSLEFAIAVFVVACPCGIGLAAPTALLVGSGLAAKHGILARGGGEAFQDMAQVDIVVFDKTGTLTEGGQPAVSHFEVPSHSTWTPRAILGLAAELESASSHPLGTAIKKYAAQHGATPSTATDFDEVAGRGIKARFEDLNCVAIIGNEAWMHEHGVILDSQTTTTLAKWTTEANSIALLAVSAGNVGATFIIVAMFAIADPLRAEAPAVIRLFQSRGIGTWIISGDNELTAKAVAKVVGIQETNVLARVLPHQKAEKIEWLQTNGVKRPSSRWQKLFGRKKTHERCIVAMVGDGINDAPALAASDVGIAIGSGSDVAISSASFILLSSNLKSLLTLCDLSQKVFNRVKMNFVWAFMYNIIAVPIAAGVIYPAGHARLAPVWASLAMALSSVSVVLSSLSLRLYKEPKV